MDGLIVVLVAVIVLALVVFVAKSLGSKAASGQDDSEKVQGFPYQKKERLLSPAERSFYGVLRSVADSRGWDVFAKVRLEDLIEARRGTEKLQAYRGRIKSRHVDFVLCDQETVSPVLAIELNDGSHARSDRQERDAFVSGALSAAGVPLVTVSAQRAYSVQELSALVDAKAGGQVAVAAVPVAGSALANGDVEAVAVGPSVQAAAGPLACPRCGSSLVERQSRKTGERFLGCSRYPDCHHTQPV